MIAADVGTQLCLPLDAAQGTAAELPGASGIVYSAQCVVHAVESRQWAYMLVDQTR